MTEDEPGSLAGLDVQLLVGQRVRRVREALGITQEQLGTRVGVQLGGRPWSRQAVSAAEQGKRAFTATELVALAHILGINSGWLLPTMHRNPGAGTDATADLKSTPAVLDAVRALGELALAAFEEQNAARESTRATLRAIEQLGERLALESMPTEGEDE